MTVGAIEQGGEIGITQERALGMSLGAETNGFSPQAHLWFHAIDNRLNVIAGAQVQDHGHHISIARAFVAGRRVMETNSQPDDLTVSHRSEEHTSELQ